MTDHVSTHQAEEDARNEAILIYVNGRIVPKAQALVSVYDAGFMLGDGVWEGIRLYDGRWAFLDEHIDRLFEAAKAIDLDIAHDARSGEAGRARHASRQRHDDRCPCPPDGDARGQDPALPAPAPVASRARPSRSSWNIRARNCPARSASPPSRTCAACR